MKILVEFLKNIFRGSKGFVALEKLENSEGRIQGWIEEALQGSKKSS